MERRARGNPEKKKEFLSNRKEKLVDEGYRLTNWGGHSMKKGRYMRPGSKRREKKNCIIAKARQRKIQVLRKLK